MPHRHLAHSRMPTAMRRRLVALVLARTTSARMRPIAAPGLIAAGPGEHPKQRLDI